MPNNIQYDNGVTTRYVGNRKRSERPRRERRKEEPTREPHSGLSNRIFFTVQALSKWNEALANSREPESAQIKILVKELTKKSPIKPNDSFLLLADRILECLGYLNVEGGFGPDNLKTSSNTDVLVKQFLATNDEAIIYGKKILEYKPDHLHSQKYPFVQSFSIPTASQYFVRKIHIICHAISLLLVHEIKCYKESLDKEENPYNSEQECITYLFDAVSSCLASLDHSEKSIIKTAITITVLLRSLTCLKNQIDIEDADDFYSKIADQSYNNFLIDTTIYIEAISIKNSKNIEKFYQVFKKIDPSHLEILLEHHDFDVNTIESILYQFYENKHPKLLEHVYGFLNKLRSGYELEQKLSKKFSRDVISHLLKQFQFEKLPDFFTEIIPVYGIDELEIISQDEDSQDNFDFSSQDEEENDDDIFSPTTAKDLVLEELKPVESPQKVSLNNLNTLLNGLEDDTSVEEKTKNIDLPRKEVMTQG